MRVFTLTLNDAFIDIFSSLEEIKAHLVKKAENEGFRLDWGVMAPIFTTPGGNVTREYRIIEKVILEPGSREAEKARTKVLDNKLLDDLKILLKTYERHNDSNQMENLSLYIQFPEEDSQNGPIYSWDGETLEEDRHEGYYIDTRPYGVSIFQSALLS